MTTKPTQSRRSMERLVLRVGEYYIRRSKMGIPRVVKLRFVTACGKYCQVSYSCCGTKWHICHADELEAENSELSDAESQYPVGNTPPKAEESQSAS